MKKLKNILEKSWFRSGLVGLVIYTLIASIYPLNKWIVNWFELPFLSGCLNIFLAIFNPSLGVGRFCYWTTLIIMRPVLGFILGVIIFVIYKKVRKRK